MLSAKQPKGAPPASPARGSTRANVTAVLAPLGGQRAPPSRREQTLDRPVQQQPRRGPLSGLFKGWDKAEELTEATTVAKQQADALDEQRERAAGSSKAAAANGSAAPAAPLPDISACLRSVGVMEARYVRVLSNLCALTYHLDKLTPSSLLRRHRLKLVSTSKVCEAKLREPRRSPADLLAEGDAMAGDPSVVEAAQEDIFSGEARALASPSPAMAAVKRVAPISSLSSVDLGAAAAGAAPAASAAAGPATSSMDGSGSSSSVGSSVSSMDVPSPVDRVAASLAAATRAASAAAQGVYTAAVPYAGPLANNITAFTTSALTSALPPVRSVAAQLQSAAAAGHSSAVATVATVTAALESTWTGRQGSASRALPKECQSPTEWFIADDPASHTRYFVIQGSDNLDHWRVNLTFDPVAFEDPALGVKVHRGVYETAAVLYERFLPLVQDHLATSPFAKVSFTGHSLGGSLGTLLMMMYVRRGVLPKSAVSPVYTFGAPAVFCEGGAGACGCSPAGGEGEAGACSSSSGQAAQGQQACGVLAALDLPEGAVRNVLMHRDIVPRAFACDYTLVADLLKRVSDSFRDHRCLNASRTVMFNFIGKVMVLQPDQEASFVGGEGLHPLLPPRPGLYVVREPAALSGVAAMLKNDASFVQQAVAQAISNLPAAASAAAEPGGSDSTALAPAAPAGKVAKGGAKAQALGPPVSSASEAVWVLMNRPHPLDILADPGAYGDLGTISRYHNPDNYTRALGNVLHARGAAWRRLVARASDAGIRYFAPVLDASQLRAAAAAAAGAGAAAASPPPSPQQAQAQHGPESPPRRSPHVGGKQSLLPRLSPPRTGSGLPHSGSSGQLA